MTGLKSQGTTLHVSQENAATTVYGSATFVKVGQVTDLGEPDGEAAEIPTTHLESTEEEFLMGLPVSGKITLSGNAISGGDTGHDELFEARANQEMRWFKVTRSDGAIRYFAAYVLRMTDFGMSVNTKVPFSASLRISGAITRA